MRSAPPDPHPNPSPEGRGASQAILRLPQNLIETKMHLILYQRDDCHLCDLALDVLAQAHAPEFDSVFIDDNAELEARYGDRVPVLRNGTTGVELGWPFDVESVRRFCRLPR